MKLVALLVAAAIAAPAAAVTYDPHADYSTASNPNGVYSYGYETTLGGPLTLFTTGGSANAVAQSWTSPSVDQYLGVYNTPSSILQHPGPSGQYSILRLTLTGGSYDIGGAFSSAFSATTDVHVLANGVSLFDGTVSGPIGSAFLLNPYFTPGTTLDFAVGNGGDNYYGDSTLLSATVTSVPEPASWLLMIAGFGLVGGAVRSRGKTTVAA